MAFQGMDVAAGEAMVGSIETFGNDLEGIFEGAISATEGSEWLGPDADEYKSNFRTQIDTALSGLRDQVKALAQELQADVEEQNAASDG